jgi:hypothetical protein
LKSSLINNDDDADGNDEVAIVEETEVEEVSNEGNSAILAKDILGSNSLVAFLLLNRTLPKVFS